MNILSGAGEIIDRWLRIDSTWRGEPPRYRHRASWHRLVRSPPCDDGCALVSQLLAQVTANWQAAMWQAQRRPSDENWRFRKNLEIAEDNRRPETVLEKRIARLTGAECANQIPTASGLVDEGGGRCNVDLCERNGREFELIELKVNADTPISAAFQSLCYGVVHLFWRLHREQLIVSQTGQPVLNATAVRLRVLAPRDYYCLELGSLKWLEKSLSKGIGAISRQQMRGALEMDFRLDAFPDAFNLGCGNDELTEAWHGRGPLYHD